MKLWSGLVSPSKVFKKETIVRHPDDLERAVTDLYEAITKNYTAEEREDKVFTIIKNNVEDTFSPFADKAYTDGHMTWLEVGGLIESSANDLIEQQEIQGRSLLRLSKIAKIAMQITEIDESDANSVIILEDKKISPLEFLDNLGHSRTAEHFMGIIKGEFMKQYPLRIRGSKPPTNP